MPVNASLRFEILKRDRFACKYCGAKAPDAELVVDHVVPESLGGPSTPENLVAACVNCNAGKGNTPLDAATVAEIDEEATRFRSALVQAQQMMASTESVKNDMVNKFTDHWCRVMPSFAQPGKGDFPSTASITTRLNQLLAAGLTWNQIMDAVDVAADASHVSQRRRYTYFNGVCNRKLEALRDLAQEILREDST